MKRRMRMLSTSFLFCTMIGMQCLAVESTEVASDQQLQGDDNSPKTRLVKLPELPRHSVDTQLPALPGRETVVRPGDDLQAAINSAKRGDRIRVDPAGEWPAIVLPEKSGDGWIQIETMALDELPEYGQRVEPDDVQHMPTIWNIIEGTPRPALNTEERASRYRIVGIQFKSQEYLDSGHNKMLMLGRGRSTVVTAETPEDLPDNIILDRCIFQGHPGNTTRGLYLDGRHVAVIGSQILDMTARTESHGILITDTPGPVLIENNGIGASGINIFIGDNNKLRWEGVNASDITIRHNLLYKKPEWKKNNALKNHFEMKRGERVLFEENECLYSPVDAQIGYSIKLKTGGGDQYVADVTIRRNKIAFATGYMAITNTNRQGGLDRILSYENKIENMLPGGAAIMFLIEPRAKGVGDVAFISDQIRGKQLKSFISFTGRTSSVRRLECIGVSCNHGAYGVKGDSTPAGSATLKRYCRSFIFKGNALIGPGAMANARSYPHGNRYRAR